MNDELGDKTEAATPHRRSEARRAGNVARSADLVAAVLGFSSIMLLGQYGPRVLDAMRLILSESLGRDSITAGRIAYLLGTALAPLLAGLTLIAIAANVLQTGFLLIAPRSKDALDASRGFQRIFSGRSSVQLTINALKIALVTVTAFVATRGRMDEIIGLQGRPVAELAGAGGAIVYGVAIRVALVLVVLAAVDFLYQWFRHQRELRMTRREVKDELRRLDGDPETRQRRRRAAAAREASHTHRLVAGADIVITDAGHVAVAMAFDPRTMSCPRIVAVERDEAGEGIRQRAVLHGVPVIERSSLATGIAKHARPGADLPARFFTAVAEVLAYAEQIRRKESSSTT